MPLQGTLTLCVGILTVAVPLLLLKASVNSATPGPVACPRCDGDVPRKAVKCPNCGATVPYQDQAL